MNSSTSSSSHQPHPRLERSWRRFFVTLLSVAAGLLATLYAFVVLIDPWGSLPLSLPLPRVPISSNARFSFPALARNPAFDAAILGTSTARLIRPVDLDPAFDAHFVNLAMNSATAWEQTQLLQVFLQAHPNPKAIIIDIDATWCGPTNDRLTPRPFPDWMYASNRWGGYRHMLTPYAVQEAANQLMVMLHLKTQRYGTDGYTSFVPPDSTYDPARVERAFDTWPPVDQTPANPTTPQNLPALTLLAPALATIPPTTRTILFFPPAHIDQQGHPNSQTALRWTNCKHQVTALAAAHDQVGHAHVIDMLIPSDITQDRTNYWDPLHYRIAIARRIATALAQQPRPTQTP